MDNGTICPLKISRINFFKYGWAKAVLIEDDGLAKLTYGNF